MDSYSDLGKRDQASESRSLHNSESTSSQNSRATPSPREGEPELERVDSSGLISAEIDGEEGEEEDSGEFFSCDFYHDESGEEEEEEPEITDELRKILEDVD